MSTADALCLLLLLAPRQGHRSGYPSVGQTLLRLCGSVTEVALGRSRGHLRGLSLPWGCLGGPESSRCPSPELLEMVFNRTVGTIGTRCRLDCGIGKGSAWAGWYPVPVPGAGPFARMTLGGTRSAGIPLSGMGKKDAKPLLTLRAPCITPPAHFVGIRVLNPRGWPR